MVIYDIINVKYHTILAIIKQKGVFIMKRILPIIILPIIFLNSSFFTVIASPPPYETFNFKDTSEWIKWINTADYNEIESNNQSNFSNKMLVEVPRTVGYVLVPKWNGTNLSEIHRDGWYPISTFPAMFSEDNKIRFLGWYSFDVQTDNILFSIRIFPIPLNIDNPMDYLDIFWNENHENYIKFFEHYAVVIYAEKPVPENFYSKFSLEKVMLTNADIVVESFDMDGGTLISKENEGYMKSSWLGIFLIVLVVVFLLLKIIQKKNKIKS